MSNTSRFLGFKGKVNRSPFVATPAPVLSDLPTATPHAVRPRKRPSSQVAYIDWERLDGHTLVSGIQDQLLWGEQRKAWAMYKQLSTAELVVLNMKRAGYALDVRDYNNLMLIYHRNDDLRSVVEAFESLSTNSYPLLRSKVSVLPPLRLSMAAPSVTARAPFRRVVPNLRSFHILMSAYASTGRVLETTSTFKELTALHPTAAVDPTAYALLISAYGNSSRRGPQDLESVKSLFETYNNFKKPDRRVLDAAVRGLGFCGDFDAAKRVFEGYESVYGVLEYGLESVDSMMAVLQVFGDCAGGEALYSRFFEGGPVGEYAPFFDMPLGSTVKSLMRLNLSAGNSRRVKDLFENTLKATQLADGEAHEIMVNCYLNDGNIEAAQQLFDFMQVRGYRIGQELLDMMETATESVKFQ
ncbi:hypothetical protein BDR26DRAFT_929964 [Obelidium mucronatum]|nr:hypothetical protein BDR26DRAFT_929964 [Obelidium mucronatum]